MQFLATIDGRCGGTHHTYSYQLSPALLPCYYHYRHRILFFFRELGFTILRFHHCFQKTMLSTASPYSRLQRVESNLTRTEKDSINEYNDVANGFSKHYYPNTMLKEIEALVTEGPLPKHVKTNVFEALEELFIENKYPTEEAIRGVVQKSCG
eukprot:GEZU01027478.1.p1 GENE.GEZU01027478.1~~GEZU01027478.1.p1  ORF type:complete len:153 (+),score=3.08 GEZU01027478.1:316-774(+)